MIRYPVFLTVASLVVAGARPVAPTPRFETPGGLLLGGPIGSAFALLDGAEANWYLVADPASEGSPATALVLPASAPSRESLAVLTALDWPDVDVSTFEITNDGIVSFGSYAGSVLTISFPFRPSDDQRVFQLTGGSPASVLFRREVGPGSDPMTSFFSLETGTLSLDRIDSAESDSCRFEGRFSGTFVRLDQLEQILALEGRFSVDECLALRHDTSP